MDIPVLWPYSPRRISVFFLFFFPSLGFLAVLPSTPAIRSGAGQSGKFRKCPAATTYSFCLRPGENLTGGLSHSGDSTGAALSVSRLARKRVCQRGLDPPGGATGYIARKFSMAINNRSGRWIRSRRPFLPVVHFVWQSSTPRVLRQSIQRPPLDVGPSGGKQGPSGNSGTSWRDLTLRLAWICCSPGGGYRANVRDEFRGPGIWLRSTSHGKHNRR